MIKSGVAIGPIADLTAFLSDLYIYTYLHSIQIRLIIHCLSLVYCSMV